MLMKNDEIYKDFEQFLVRNQQYETFASIDLKLA